MSILAHIATCNCYATTLCTLLNDFVRVDHFVVSVVVFVVSIVVITIFVSVCTVVVVVVVVVVKNFGGEIIVVGILCGEHRRGRIWTHRWGDLDAFRRRSRYLEIVIAHWRRQEFVTSNGREWGVSPIARDMK
jgi:hypothetical protein